MAAEQAEVVVVTTCLLRQFHDIEKIEMFQRIFATRTHSRLLIRNNATSRP